MNQRPNPSPAEMFDEFFGSALFVPWSRLLLEHAAPQPGEHVLDLACGAGTVARQVAPIIGKHGRVVGADINPGMLAVARARPSSAGVPIEWVEGNAMALDFPDESFDLVLCQQGLQFFPDRVAALREIWRVTRFGGRVTLNVWQALDRHPLYEALCKAEARHLGVPLADVASPWSLSNAAELHGLLTDANFKRVEVVPRMLDVNFPSPDRFVYLTLLAAAAFIPDFDWDDEAVRSPLIESVSLEVAPLLERYRNGEKLTFPTSWNMALAWKQQR